MTELTRALIDRCFPPSSSELMIGGFAISRLAEQYGTPFFAYDAGIIDRQLVALRSALPAEFDIHYSVKANPNLAIISHLLANGCGLEIASAGEFVQALAAGAAPAKIVFAGPAKTEGELELTIGSKIGEIHVESESEIRRVRAICSRYGFRARVAVRVNPTSDAQGGAMRMGGKPAPFGVDEEKLYPFIDMLLAEPAFNFRGVHIFAGTQILDWAVLLSQYRKGIEIARNVARYAGQSLKTVDLGGGLGIPYFDRDQSLDLKSLSIELARLFAEIRREPEFKGTHFLVEPGRFLVGEAGVYVTRIVDIKESRGKKFLILDGGMNHHLAASGNLGQTIKRNYPIVLAQKLDRPAGDTVDVSGPLCTPLDTLGRGVVLPVAEIGDLVAVLQSGAYARSASPLGFLSHPTPAEVMVDQGEHFLIRTRGRAEDAMRDVQVPSPRPVRG
jgi:diaminopimelate decarboxylase